MRLSGLLLERNMLQDAKQKITEIRRKQRIAAVAIFWGIILWVAGPVLPLMFMTIVFFGIFAFFYRRISLGLLLSPKD